MQTLSTQEFHDFCKQADMTLLKTTYDRPKLLETTQGEMVKIFYPRRKRFSSNNYKPYALRFSANAERLRALGFKTPDIQSIKHCPDLNTYIITYKKLSGQDARTLATPSNHQIIHQVAAYIAALHEKGVFFRSIHLENLLYQDDGSFALLDIVDVQFKPKSLSLYLRFRNLKHLFMIADDRKFWVNFGITKFLMIYFNYSTLSFLSKKLLTFLNPYTKYLRAITAKV